MLQAVRQSPYPINNYSGFVKKQREEEESSTQHQGAAQTQTNEELPQINPDARKNIREQLEESKANHQQAVASRDANLKNASINIAQIIKDFKNTIKAIGTPPELSEEVNEYLNLIEKQVTKENPDGKLVRSNLKNASSILDTYISETLQRPSKVVENWIDALFLQQINYKFNDDEVNPQFLVKFPNHKKDEKEDEENLTEDENEDEENEKNKKKNKYKTEVIVPQDEELKSLFIKAKKYSYANDPKKAMALFKSALDRAIEVEDKETESKVLFEIGKIYDKNDYLAQALTSYNKSLQATRDMSVKTQAHYSMAKIYDDVAQFEPAINHYMSSISYAGESENLVAQSTSLTKIGNIYSDEYKKEAFDFLKEAELIAAETDNPKAKGYVSSNIAIAYDKFNDPHNALKYFSTAIREYDEAQSTIKVAINYKRAAEVMQDFNNNQKAKKLYKKALAKARQTEDVQLMKEIHEALNII